ncbi:MAG: two-component regulator propeller domain-containing protein [Crocinitomicaceae bacterium]
MRLLIFFLFCSANLFSQIGTGQWRLHIPSDKAIDVIAKSDRVFTAYTNGLTEYGYSSKELSVWNAVNGLSDITVTCLGNSESNNAIFVGYENGNLDKIKNNAVTNIPAIKLAQVQGSKRINRIVEFDNHVYVATGFAIVKIDPVKNEVRDSYYPTNGNQSIIDIAFRNDSIFALTDDKMYTGYAFNVALADPAQWTLDSRVPEITSHEYAGVETVNDRIFVLKKGDAYGDDTVFTLTQTSLVHELAETFNPEVYGINELEGKLAVNYFPGTLIYDEFLVQDNVLSTYASGEFVKANVIDYANSNYWIADNDYGLVKYQSAGVTEKIQFEGPPKNDFYSMDWEDGKLIVNGGALKALSATINRAGVYVFKDETWQLKDQNNMNLWSDGNIWDFITASINPKNSDQYATGTYSFTPLSIGTMDGQITDTFTPLNSILEVGSIGNGMTLLSDIQYDEDGNLWILNGYANAPLKVYTKDGLWYEFDLGTTAKSKFSDNIEIDYNGNKWLSIRGAGLYGYNDNGTIADASDDQYVLLNIGENTGALPSNQINAIAVDFDNEIWIGTDNGFAVLYNSDGAFGAAYGDYNAQRIKLEFEGNVEYVLGDTDINDIVVDGANRKWFATSNSGIILLSPDGLEIVEQHTMENSPLISDNVLDLEIDHNTGEMYIITDMGMMSYRTDATYEDPEYENVTVFPNPVRPEYSGPITIQGIRYNSDVKITDIAGNLVYKTTSNGGTATWDGKTLTGERVATGVYLIWTAANEGKGRKVGKVLVVN